MSGYDQLASTSAPPEMSDEGTPEAAERLKEIFRSHDGLVIASPEYNSSITPLLKNTIDWLSRRAEDEPRLVAFRGKTAALLAASPGALGGLRGLVHLRSILGNIGVLVMPTQVAVPKANTVFAEDGSIADERLRGRLADCLKELAAATDRLAPAG